MLHRLFTGVVLGAALWYAMSFLHLGRELALMVALLPILSAALNLMTGFIFILAAAVALPVIFYGLAVNESWFAEAAAAVRRLTEPR